MQIGQGGLDNGFRQGFAKCPKCGTHAWDRKHRTWWQKLTKPKQRLFYCRECGHIFWGPKGTGKQTPEI